MEANVKPGTRCECRSRDCLQGAHWGVAMHQCENNATQVYLVDVLGDPDEVALCDACAIFHAPYQIRCKCLEGHATWPGPEARVRHIGNAPCPKTATRIVTVYGDCTAPLCTPCAEYHEAKRKVSK